MLKHTSPTAPVTEKVINVRGLPAEPPNALKDVVAGRVVRFGEYPRHFSLPQVITQSGAVPKKLYKPLELVIS